MRFFILLVNCYRASSPKVFSDIRFKIVFKCELIAVSPNPTFELVFVISSSNLLSLFSKKKKKWMVAFFRNELTILDVKVTRLKYSFCYQALFSSFIEENWIVDESRGRVSRFKKMNNV